MKLIIIAVLACILGSLAFKRQDPVFEQLQKASQLSKAISRLFAYDFPDTLKPFEVPPRLGSIGELTEIQNPKFLLLDFPPSDISKVQSWITPFVNRYGYQSISVSYFVYIPEANSDKLQITNGMNRLTVFADGRTETKSGLTLEQGWGKATINGTLVENYFKKSGDGNTPEAQQEPH